MSRLPATLRPLALGLSLLAAGAIARAGEPDISGVETMPPYRMIRTLEYVQDSIVAGDHGAIDMQSYLLQSIDARLRKADASVFDDSRNADAALIYAMSGGNPETLRLLTSRDVDGHFDHALSDALLTYFSGQPARARSELTEIEPTLRTTRLGPFVSLVTANAEARGKPKEALTLYDWVRLMAPGSILEESALRRSLALADRLKRVAKGIDYARAYAQRFIHSPYAGQFADLFVQLVVHNTDSVTQADVVTVLSNLDRERQAAIYLRIARAATVEGKFELARASATRADQLSSGTNTQTATLATFYQGAADIPSPSVQSARRSVEDTPAHTLSGRDRALRMAALAVARQVTQAPAAALTEEHRAEAPAPTGTKLRSRQPIPDRPVVQDPGAPRKAPEAFDTFVEAKRGKLTAIDDLLKEASE